MTGNGGERHNGARLLLLLPRSPHNQSAGPVDFGRTKATGAKRRAQAGMDVGYGSVTYEDGASSGGSQDVHQVIELSGRNDVYRITDK